MFREKEYQVKDIMEMYDISRDTIKYYETHGLICSKRKENGYRVFDEMNVRKLKKILALRDMGLTVEEALLHCQSESIEKRTEIMTNNEYENLVNVRPQYKEQIIQMLLLDFITRQDDRHLSNIAIKVNREGEIFYPLYDNGRSLFYEDTEEMVKAACENVELCAAVSATVEPTLTISEILQKKVVISLS